jgi:nitrite reductase (NADH) large subunit
MSQREDLVVVGNGMAAQRLVKDIVSRAPGQFNITVVGEELGLAYNRVLLSSLLAGDVSADDVELEPQSWWDACGVKLITGKRATEIDTRARFVRLRGGAKVPFNKLVLATGSEAIRLPLPGADLSGVFTFRDKTDVDAIIGQTKKGSKAVVIGGGLLGLEAAYGLSKLGARVTVVHLMDRLMERQLDGPASALLKTSLEQRGIDVVLNADSAAIQGRRVAGGLRLKNGRTIDADMVVMAVGIKPNVSLARQADIAVKRGIAVDDHMETSVPGIYAIGECAEHRGVCYGLVEPAYEQARVLASHLTGNSASYEGSLLSTNLKVSGVSVFSAGDFAGEAGTQAIVLSDPHHGSYRKLVLSNGVLKGAVLVGDTHDALWYLELIRTGHSVAAERDGLIFGRAFCQPPVCVTTPPRRVSEHAAAA